MAAPSVQTASDSDSREALATVLADAAARAAHDGAWARVTIFARSLLKVASGGTDQQSRSGRNGRGAHHDDD